MTLDGDFDADDSTRASTFFQGTTMGWNVLTNPDVGNRKGYAGYEYTEAVSKYHVRNRVLDPHLGRWLTRDPLGYVDGMSVYEYVASNPPSKIDSHGLAVNKCFDDWENFDQEAKQECCCAAAWNAIYDWNPIKLSEWLGITVCCRGEVFTCLNEIMMEIYQPPSAQQIIRDCAQSHEDTHADHHFCCPADRANEDLIWHGADILCEHVPEPKKACIECFGYMDELNCLQGGLKDCGTDSNCRKQIEDRIEVVEANMNDYCATCGKTAWPSFIGPSIPPIVIGRI